ncbi:MAG: aldehyde dehydrogenase family protein [Pedobacter sp.]|nr:MAG: aldehyde dehydrogenase family protein [Pedobacter sp.]
MFKAQQAYKYTLRKSNASSRIAKLRTLKRVIEQNEAKIYQAFQKDLRKSEFETAVTEVIFTYGEIDFAIKNLSSWMSPKRVGKTASSFFAKNRIYYEPKGACLIISPWNYPFQLTIGPLVSAIAAGNCAIVKPSELSPAVADVVCAILKEVFEEQEVACIKGNADVSTALLKLPFDHIFFTGSTAIGKVVMEAAAKNLTSVTLELGGKSPTIIDEKADLASATTKIAWGKLVNSGQTCIAPDHVFIHENQRDQFIGLYKDAVKQMYFNNKGEVDKNVYGKIINQKNYDRLKTLVNEAFENGARIDFGGDFDDATHTINPIILTNIPEGAKVMEEEIFGPILPIITYKNIEEVIDQINARSKPLALYIFSESKKNIQHIIKNTSAGGTCVNDVLIHISNPKLPFGGVNGSGMGSSHGFYGFKNFSHERTVVFQSSINFNKMIYPPYHGKEWVLKLLKKLM